MIKHVAQWLWRATKGIRCRLLFNGVLGMVRVAAGLLFIYVSKQLIDMATGHIAHASAAFTLYLALLVVFMVAQIGAVLCNSWFTNQTEVRMKNRLRHNLFTHLMNVTWMGKGCLHSGDILNRLEEDVRVVTEVVCRSLPDLTVTLINLSAAFLFLYRLSPPLAWCILFIMPVFLGLSKIYIRRMRRLTKDIRSTDSDVQSVLQESIQHRIVIQTMEQHDQMAGKLDMLQQALYDQTMDRTRFSLFSRSMVSFGFVAGYLFVFIWSLFQLQQGLITFGVMSAFLQLVGQIQRPTIELTRLLPQFVHATTSIDRLHELEALPGEETADRHRLDGKVGILMQEVTFGYEEGKEVLHRFTHDFKPGSRTAVMGETGAGKSTTIRLILSLLKPKSGTIELYNASERIVADARSRCNTVYVPQGNSLLSGTIRDNLLLGDPDAGDPALYEVLHHTAADFVKDLPEGLNTVCGEQGGGLSEGQAQRIAIARGLLRKGNILLLDEFSASLDEETEEILMERLLANYPDKTMIFITHHETVAGYCSDVVHLKKL
ncbi:ABC transporter, ATP-binding protein [Bacteroidetes bacterium oral taxon 272 str. F0290]|uniref:ABC transporter ATP-binding protein n=1 Tax=Phocaeicola abscessus TaxID=555313 RepID=UPI000385A6F9|nr:ABC transporter ATP-binding protein [Phocaeicola abscessus]EPT33977.1 ABC transporter, ATP-binding protein [Bacteroidetes bacterium oral taxon 272 str. F0290]